MNTQDFLAQIDRDTENVLCLDFDGVIHDHSLGFHDGTIYGDPLDGALESIKTLSSRYKLIIYTCKANPDRPLISGKTGVELIWEWLDKHGVRDYISDVTYTKPSAVAYIDDKAIRFESWAQISKQTDLLT